MPYIGNIVQDFSVNTAMLNSDSVTSIKIDDGTIVNADINDSAAIAGTKVSPDFGSQNITTTGNLNTGGNLTMTGTSCLLNFTDTNNNSDFRIQVESGSFLIEDATNSYADRFVINSSGNIGIGTASPQAVLHVEGGSEGNLIQLSNTHTGATNSDGFVFGINSSLTYLYNRENKDITFGTNNSERMRITSNGLVSIGKTSNAGKALELYQAADAALRIQNSTTGTGSSDGVLLEANGSDFLVFNYESGS